ncbi:radical SAM protein [Streptomyces sp. SCA3-4]|uniref:radical SAM protein n=1 Tax=Streptomyces sichuanensis TaxID=2871810 RepID=UPI001CE329B4|nr:radical SAM protein [Streptomyces sichuanensis]MCA6091840.1 radical SAM protein [Streptomyces sichuanensis]
MHLADIMAARPVPAGGVLVALTARCPLHCAHCSTASTMAGGHADAAVLRRFFAGFTTDDHPGIALFTGGEPLLRPALLTELATAARAVGTRTAVLTGGFFARHGTVPAAVLAVAEAVDHFSLSIDAFHEREVPRRAVLGALRLLLDRAVDVSLHIVGDGPADPYLADVTADVLRAFGDAVPMLVGEIRPAGRAAAWAARPAAADTGEPCAMAAWPVLTVDGTITACCNQDVVDGPARPAHLRLGSAATDDWAAVRERATGSPVLRTIRSLGPPAGPRDTCANCRALGENPDALRRAHTTGEGPVGALLDWEATRRRVAAGPVALARRYGCPPYAGLVAPRTPPVEGRSP